MNRLSNGYQEAVERADARLNHEDIATTIGSAVEEAYNTLITGLPSTESDLALQALAHLSFAH